jgi:hypothetical protein
MPPSDTPFEPPAANLLNPPRGFFAYPLSPPAISPTISAAIASINSTQHANIRSWEELRVSGKCIISEICAAIDEAQFLCADITGINPNVMFEIGYAIATDKRIWLIRDESYTDAKKEFAQVQLLTTIGYSPYTNSEEIIKGFFHDEPHETSGETVWRQSIEPVLAMGTGEHPVLYLMEKHQTEASLQVTRILEDSKIPHTVDDPREMTPHPAYWYAEQLWESLGLLAHFCSSAREGFRLHNARYALVCGMAHGFRIPTLMISEQDDLLAPIDYRDSLRHYTTPKEAANTVDEWLLPIRHEDSAMETIKANRSRAIRLATELKGFHLQLGDYIAEDESSSLNSYFVETTVSQDILNGTQNVFVGRKGTGKSANLIHASQIVGSDVQNLVCLIKPAGYEIEGLVRLFAGYTAKDFKGYVIESLWKFMLYTELAKAAADQINETELWRLTEPDSKGLVDLLEDEKKTFAGDFSVRLERMVARLEIVPKTGSNEEFRKGISEALHVAAIGKLRSSLARVLNKKRRVVLLVDNLDKAWTKKSDLAQLADFLLGLLIATSRIGDELSRTGKEKMPVAFSSAIFLRSDIFEKVQAAAREPDKLSFTRLRWDDDELLLRVIEERYIASHGPDSDPANMWHKYFCPQFQGVPTREYLVNQILKRPRDIVYLVKSAVSFAVNRKHDRVEERDIADAEIAYSQYALDSILVENGISIPQLQDVLDQFSGSPAILSHTQASQTVSRANIPIEEVDNALEHLVRLSFLGVETASDSFVFSDESRELRRNLVLAQRYREQTNSDQRYLINRAFRAFLLVAAPPLSQG